jgi:DNA polymerase-3 subunit alpha
LAGFSCHFSEIGSKPEKEIAMLFVHLHVHTQYSFPEGACVMDALIKRAKKLKMKALAITDRNTLAGAVEFSEKCRKAGIKPIIGLETTIIGDDKRAFPIILLAENQEGYQNLVSIVSLSFSNNAQHPYIDRETLIETNNGLICLSGGVEGEIGQLLLEGKENVAVAVMEWYRSIFTDRYYLELQNHGTPMEAFVMPRLQNLSFKTKIPSVLTNNCSYVLRRDALVPDFLYSIHNERDSLSRQKKAHSSNEYYLKTELEMCALFDFPPTLFINTSLIAKRISFDLIASQKEMLSEHYSQNFRSRVTSIFEGKGIHYNSHGNIITVDSKIDRQRLVDSLQLSLPDYTFLPIAVYPRWSAKEIYALILRLSGVEKKKIDMLIDEIPVKSSTLIKAILTSTDFSCLALEDYVYSQAFDIAHNLQGTFTHQTCDKDIIACLPTSYPIPLGRTNENTSVCQYEMAALQALGCFLIDFTGKEKSLKHIDQDNRKSHYKGENHD